MGVRRAVAGGHGGSHRSAGMGVASRPRAAPPIARDSTTGVPATDPRSSNLAQLDVQEKIVPKKNGPQSGMREEELEWQHHQGERVSQRMPHLLREMKNLTQKMRSHFQDDPVALKLWDDHAKEILNGFEHNLPIALVSPTNLPTAVRYEHLMKRKARSMTFVSMFSGGLSKRLVAAGSIVAVAGLALVFRPTTGKQKEAK